MNHDRDAVDAVHGRRILRLGVILLFVGVSLDALSMAALGVRLPMSWAAGLIAINALCLFRVPSHEFGTHAIGRVVGLTCLTCFAVIPAYLAVVPDSALTLADAWPRIAAVAVAMVVLDELRAGCVALWKSARETSAIVWRSTYLVTVIGHGALLGLCVALDPNLQRILGLR